MWASIVRVPFRNLLADFRGLIDSQAFQRGKTCLREQFTAELLTQWAIHASTIRAVDLKYVTTLKRLNLRHDVLQALALDFLDLLSVVGH
jgi:hypothetical protein